MRCKVMPLLKIVVFVLSFGYLAAQEGCDGLSRAQSPPWKSLMAGKISGTIGGYQFQEVYDSKLQRGFRTFKDADTSSTLYYHVFNDTKEIFKIQGYNCDLADTANEGGLGQYNESLSINEFFGSSNYFMRNLFSAFTFVQAAVLNSDKLMQTSDADALKLCLNNTIVDYQFKRINQGQRKLQLITYYNKVDGDLKTTLYRIDDLSLSEAYQKLSVSQDLLAAPIGFGCARSAIVQDTRPFHNMPPKIYWKQIQVNSLQTRRTYRVSVDTISQIYSIRTLYDRTVVDQKNDLFFNIRQNVCQKIGDTSTVFKEALGLQRNFDLIDSKLWIVSDNANYLGNVTKNGQTYAVFEQIFDDFYEDSIDLFPAIVTQYARFGAQSFANILNTKLPTAVTVKIFKSPEGKKIYDIITMAVRRFVAYDEGAYNFNCIPCLSQNANPQTIELRFKASSAIQYYYHYTAIQAAFTRKAIEAGIRPLQWTTAVLNNPLRVSVNIYPVTVNFDRLVGTSMVGGMQIEETRSYTDCLRECEKVQNCAGFTQCNTFKGTTCSLGSGNITTTSNASCVSGSRVRRAVYMSPNDVVQKLEAARLGDGFRFAVNRVANFTLGSVVVTSAFKTTENDYIQAFPSVLSLLNNQTSISSRVERIDLKTNATSFYEEFYDSDARRGQIKKILRDAKGSQQYGLNLLFFYDTDEQFSLGVDSYTCKTLKTTAPSKLDIAKELFPASILTALDAKGLQFVGPSAILVLANLIGMNLTRSSLYIGEYSDVYSASATVGRTNVTIYTVKLLGKNKLIQRPIKVEFQENGKLTSVLNFADFKPGTEKNKITAIPDGYGCQRNRELVLPTPPTVNITEYQATIELVDTKWTNKRLETTTQSLIVVRNFNYGLHSYYLRRYSKSKLPHPHRLVHDSKRKINYATDFFTRTCSIESTPYAFGLKWPEGNDTELDIFDPKFINVDNNYQYLGNASVRGIPSLVFEKSIRFYQRTMPRSVTITQFFINTQEPGIKYQSADPIQVIFRVFGDINRARLVRQIAINVVGFQNRITQRGRVFDISGCFERPQEYTWFEMTFAVKRGNALAYTGQAKMVEDKFYEALQFIPPTRLPIVLADVSPNAIVVSAKLLERTPIEFSYRRVANKKNRLDRVNGQGTLTPSVDLCGQLCYDTPSCVGFSYCDQSLECEQITGVQRNIYYIEKSLEDTQGCSTYFKTNDSDPDGPDPSDYSIGLLIEHLKYQVEQQSIMLILPGQDNSNLTSDAKPSDALFTAIDMKTDTEPGFRVDLINAKVGSTIKSSQDGAIEMARSIYNDYFVKQSSAGIDFEKVRSNNGRKELLASVKSCKDICDQNTDCQSFSYCGGSGECVTTSMFGKDLDKVTVINAKCTVLSKTYVAAYTLRAMYSLGDKKTTVEASSVEDCAKACSTYANFNCLSFDYCTYGRRKQTCALFKTHSQVNRTSTTLNYDSSCGHYSKKYTFDFKPYAGKKLKSENLFTARSLTVDNCAQTCEQEGCSVFEYCQNPVLNSYKANDVCRITSTVQGASNFERNRNCTVYVKNQKSDSSAGNRNTRHSTGLGIFLALVMLLLGFGLGVGGIWFYQNKLPNYLSKN